MSQRTISGYLTCLPCRTDRVAVMDVYPKDLGRGVKRLFASGNCPSCGDLVEARVDTLQTVAAR
ncbi:hypothetical protein BJY16_005508 [Actinoplanes octamycinicus]|uniref:DUF5679 domain-containing protein n=1 Tax=Actinoplanes octamycinicus TaxID=135948 RepID=A0A7W7H1E9_9ACTN|nr:hypothetical protein [Actinoplanes octamycinicus]MBB4742049.1 hypothetical protein [Actinoplanes octamycinicus]GIE63715.1 hypothetical protein Aoc01nite_91170 [Actinoplanes octamycinicus]